MSINRMFFTQTQGSTVLAGMIMAVVLSVVRTDIENRLVYILSGGISGYIIGTFAALILYYLGEETE